VPDIAVSLNSLSYTENTLNSPPTSADLGIEEVRGNPKVWSDSDCQPAGAADGLRQQWALGPLGPDTYRRSLRLAGEARPAHRHYTVAAGLAARPARSLPTAAARRPFHRLHRPAAPPSHVDPKPADSLRRYPSRPRRSRGRLAVSKILLALRHWEMSFGRLRTTIPSARAPPRVVMAACPKPPARPSKEESIRSCHGPPAKRHRAQWNANGSALGSPTDPPGQPGVRIQRLLLLRPAPPSAQARLSGACRQRSRAARRSTRRSPTGRPGDEGVGNGEGATHTRTGFSPTGSTAEKHDPSLARR